MNRCMPPQGDLLNSSDSESPDGGSSGTCTDSHPPTDTSSKCAYVLQAVACAHGIDIRALRAARRCSAPVAFARQIAMYLAHVSCGLTLTQVGRGFGRDRTTVAHACQVVEDRRDTPDTDLALDYLEAAIVEWFGAVRMRQAACAASASSR